MRFTGPWTHRDVSANGIRLHVATLGNGPLVLFLHGFPEFWWCWHRQLVAVAEAGFTAAAVDLRGYGDSDKPPRGYDGWTLAGDVAGLIRALGARRARLVGHGWGGLLAWATAALQPRLVRSVTAISAPHPLTLRKAISRGLAGAAVTAARMPGRNQATAIAGMFTAQLPIWPERALIRDHAALVNRLMTAWSGPDWRDTQDFAEVSRHNREAMLINGVAHCSMEYLRWALRSQPRADGRRFARALADRPGPPVLQIQGRLDPVVLESTAADSMPWHGRGSRYRVLPDTGHFPHHERPERVNSLLVDFLTDSDLTD